MCTASQCLRCWGAVILVTAALGSTWELVGHRDEEEAHTSSCTEGHDHTSLLRDLWLLSATGRDWHHQKKASDTNGAVLTAAFSLVSLLFTAKWIDMLLVPWPFLRRVKPPFCLNKHTHGKDLTQRLLKLLEGHFHGHWSAHHVDCWKTTLRHRSEEAGEAEF